METYHVILLCIAACRVYQLLDTEVEPAIVNDHEIKKIQYLVNGQEVYEPHHFYYWRILGLHLEKEISDVTIKNASIHQLNIIDVNNELQNFYELQVKAAEMYIQDEWAYFVNKN